MIIIKVFALSFLLSLPVPVTKPLERAFLENSPEILRGILTAEGDIPVSLPDPLSLADQLSPDQTFLFFKRIFSVFKTTEFFVSSGFPSFPGQPGGILKARWSFRDEKTGNLYPMRVFFYLVAETPAADRGRGNPVKVLRIVEIRAEKL